MLLSSKVLSLRYTGATWHPHHLFMWPATLKDGNRVRAPGSLQHLNTLWFSEHRKKPYFFPRSQQKKVVEKQRKKKRKTMFNSVDHLDQINELPQKMLTKISGANDFNPTNDNLNWSSQLSCRTAANYLCPNTMEEKYPSLCCKH